MEVWDRCGDEWITAGANGIKIAISGPSIEAAMNVTGIRGEQARAGMFDKIKMVSRAVAGELFQERMNQAEK
jgi:hypothetical protein